MDNIKNSPNSTNAGTASVMRLSEPNDINLMSPWDIDFRQIEAGPMACSICPLAGENVTLLQVSISRSVHQTGSSPKGMVSVGLIQPKQVENWQGMDTPSANLLSFGSADPFDGVSVTDFVGTTLSISQKYIEGLADQMGLDIPETLRTSKVPEILGSRQYLSDLHSLSSRLLASNACAVPARDEEAIVTNLLLATNANKHLDHAYTSRSRTRALSRAVEIMVANDKENVSIGKLCEHAGVSWRTLDRAFKEKFGFGPKRYQNRLRLNRIRSKLLLGSKSSKISDIANDWGYWHLGQFAHDYKAMFGELPSATLRQDRWMH